MSQATLPWRDAVVPAVRKLRRTFGLKSPRGRSRAEQGREARARRYAWLQDILHAARHAGLGDETHRRLLLAGLPAEWLPHLSRGYPPDEQLAFDVCVLAHLPRAGEGALLPLSLWLRNAHALVHPLRLAPFFGDAVDVHEAKGAMPLSWLPFPDSPYETLDRAAYRAAQQRRARRGGDARGNVREFEAAPSGDPPEPRAGVLEAVPQSIEGVPARDGADAEAPEACPYCGARQLPIYDFYTGRSCIACFIDREEALQEKLAREREAGDPWHRVQKP